MSLIDSLHRKLDSLALSPILRPIFTRSARKAFIANRNRNLFFGVYPSWEEALAASGEYGVVGYDNEGSAVLYDQRLRVDDHDYPALHWLNRSLQDGLRGVFDVGGAIGIKFIAFRESLDCFPDLVWRVYDVPAMVAHGRELAAARGYVPRLQFTDSFHEGEGLEILFVSGALQYLPHTLSELLSTYKQLPRRVIINTTPVHPDYEFFTVNSIGTAFCPYRIQTQRSLIRRLSALGYRLRESWINPGKALRIPCRPDLELDHYSGYCLELASKT